MAAPSLPKDERVGIGAFLTRRALEALGVGLLVVALLLAVALWGHNANDPSLNHATAGPSTNPLGYFGASVADLLFQTLGLASWIIVLILPLWGLRLILGRPLAWPWLPVAALPLALLALAAYLATLRIPDSWPYWVGLGGFVGDFMLQRLARPVGSETYPMVTGIAALVCLVLAVGVSWRETWQAGRALVVLPFRMGRGRPAEPESSVRRRPQPAAPRAEARPAP
ncbi:MAG: DNA translocase FtsK 4TM domain-containing protein, partial [Geminicoccaceae bacterium]